MLRVTCYEFLFPYIRFLKNSYLCVSVKICVLILVMSKIKEKNKDGTFRNRDI